MINIKRLNEKVEYCLEYYPETRNSDIELTTRIWKEFHKSYLFDLGSKELYVKVKDLFELPREDNIKRVRAKIQNDDKKWLPTDWKIAKKRGILEGEWRQAMGYPSKEPKGQQKMFETRPTGGWYE